MDFNAIDSELWSVVTAGVPTGAAVTGENDRIKLTGRGHLNTAHEFDPHDAPIMITGTELSSGWSRPRMAATTSKRSAMTAPRGTSRRLRAMSSVIVTPSP